MSRLIKITPEIELEPEPTGQEYGYEVFEELQPIETTTCHIIELKEEIHKKKDPIPEDVQPVIDLTEEQLEDIQMKDKFIKKFSKYNSDRKTTFRKTLLFRRKVIKEVHL